MAKTIIQTIGPLYGESVNGTVFGRPNGSIFVPSTNVVSVDYVTSQPKIYKNAQGSILGTANLKFVAEAQDLASVIKVEIYEDEELTTLVSSRYYAAGNFNFVSLNFGTAEDGVSIVTDQTYYVVAYLDNNGSHVATSTVITVVGQ